MRKEIFKAVVDQLAAMVDDQGNQLLEWIDFDKGQFNQQSKAPEIFPAALINIGRLNTKSYNDEAQLVEVELSIDIYQHAYGETWHKATDKETTLNSLDLMDSIYLAINGLDIENITFTPFLRTSEERLRTLPVMWAHRITFSGQVLDLTGVTDPDTMNKPDPTWLS